jgi:cell division protein FtsA
MAVRSPTWRTRQTCSTSPASTTGPRASCRVGALADVIQPRVEELYELIQAELRRSGFEDVLSSGIVLTGGASVMPGMIELGEEIFHMPVRLGVPKYQGALADVVQSPRFATACGLLLEAQTQRKRGLKVRETRDVKQVFGRMKSWFEKNF